MVIKANLKDAFGVRKLVPFLDGRLSRKVDLSEKIIVDWDPGFRFSVNGSQQWDSANGLG